MHLSFSRLLLFCALVASPLIASAQENGVRVSTLKEIAAEFDAVPCNNKERLAAVKTLFERMGAKAEEIVVEKVSGIENVVIRKAGAETSTDKIVIGAHFDKTASGCGAIDNWTGIVAVAHIYRTLRESKFDKTIIFVGFGEEERGLYGSKAMVSKLKKEELGDYCAMINIDSLGVAPPQAADNMSSPKLLNATAELAKNMDVPFAHAAIPGAGGDSQSFLSRKIPAIMLHGLTSDWPKLLHSANDKAENVNRQNVYLGYQLALSLLVKVAEAPCAEFKEGKPEKEKGKPKEPKEKAVTKDAQ